MNSDNVKGALQKIGGHIEEAAGALVGDENLKVAGKEDQLKGSARDAWGNVKDAAGNLVDQAKASKMEAQARTDRSQAYEKEHEVIVELPKEKSEESK